MIVITAPSAQKKSEEFLSLMAYLAALPDIKTHLHQVQGSNETLTEIYLLGNTASLDQAAIEEHPGVARVVRVSKDYRILGRHNQDPRGNGFTYRGVRFDQDSFNLFAGLCAVDNPQNVESMLQALQQQGLTCTRMGAYKPRSSPYSFQGHGKSCLPWLFELAGKYGIQVIAMEITHESHIDEINQALDESGNATGVLLQIGTRNTQNFELLKQAGRQQTHPVLLKRGFGITLEESLNAAEYLASEGNPNVIFCLRGVKSSLGDPHRNLVDFAHVPVVKRLTRMPVCVDPSHSVGRREFAPDGIQEITHATAQGVIAGANMVLVDFHPKPAEALVDGAQALRLEELPGFVEDLQIVREAYLKLQARANPVN